MKYIVLPLSRFALVITFIMTFGLVFIIISIISFIWNFNWDDSEEMLNDFVWNSNRRDVQIGELYWANVTISDYIFDKKTYFLKEKESG